MTDARSFRTLSVGLFLLGSAVAALLAAGLAEPWWLGLPSWITYVAAALAVALHARGLLADRMRLEAAGYLVAALGFSRLPAANPDFTAWLLAALAGVAYLASAETASAARRLAELVRDEGAEAHLERVATPLRNAFLLPFAAVLGALLLVRALGATFLGLLGDALAASIEAQGLFGILFGTVALAGLLAAAAWARHVRQGAEAATK